ncbi:MAG: acyltransferase domain-containing protein [Deltaproteobacteria bacterium]|nr:MAG: acyltransferase domain-containing protein [Deltaproteobacteria bacterium]
MDRVRAVIADLPGVVISHDNCPHQVVLCGEDEALQEAARRLERARILAHLLPFRSGFHAPFFEDFLEPHRRHFAALPLQPPEIPLWSATTAAPYPDDVDEMRALAIRHLVEPVRFRELVEALHADGVRVFVQVGPGSLVGFVSDTLRGRDHLAMSANEPQRSGLAQLRRLCAALFVEGADPDLTVFDPGARRGGMPLSLGVPLVHVQTSLSLSPAAPGAGTVPGTLGRAFTAVHDEVGRSLSAVQAALRSRGGDRPRAPVAPAAVIGPREETRRLSVADQPFLVDHCLIPQPPGWPVLADRNPVVPMTMSVRMMLDLAERCAPGRVAVEIEGVRAHRWMAVEPPIDLELRAEPIDDQRVRVVLEGYAEATVRLADRWPTPPPPRPPELGEEFPMELAAEGLYGERWMFHGPAYQAVRRLDRIGSRGITGQLVATRAEGALLDGAGQLFGYQVMRTTERNRLAMPVRIDRIELFGPEPEPGEVWDCAVFCQPPGAREVRADIEVHRGGQVWARIHGWTDWRFETDDRLWPVMHQAERHLFAVPLPGGGVRIDDPGRSGSSRDYLARRYLGAADRAHLATLSRDEASAFLYGRIAACDAVRRRAWDEGAGPLFPVEVALGDVGPGRLGASLPDGRRYTVAVASRPGRAVAVVLDPAGDGQVSPDALLAMLDSP